MKKIFYVGTIIWFIFKSIICGLTLKIAILSTNVPLAIFAMVLALYMGWRQNEIIQKKKYSEI